MEILKDERIVKILSQIYKAMIPYFMFYADEKTMLMDFEAFFKFCQDFEIFPYILSKPKIMRFFKALSSFFSTTKTQKKEMKEKIDEHLFVEILALAAFEM